MPPKPTAAQRRQAADIALRMVVLGHTRARTVWNDAKKKASKDIDVRMFDKHLAKSLDALNDVCQNALEILKLHGTLDARTTAPVLKRTQKVYDILADYHDKVRAGAQGKSPQERRPYVAVASALQMTGDEIRKWLKPLTDAGMSTSALRAPALKAI